jgi:hypothetical protein
MTPREMPLMGDEPSITCPQCGRTSYSPKDAEYKFCGACDKFHADMFYRVIVPLCWRLR